MEVNYLQELFYSLEVWGYLGPVALVAITYYASRRDRILGIMMFLVDAVVGWQYLMLMSATPGYVWHALIVIL